VTTARRSPCLINGIAALETEISILKGTEGVPFIGVKFALLSVDSGVHFGQGTVNRGWSEETMTRLHAFLESVEKDICDRLFEEGDPEGSTGGGGDDQEPPDDGVPSIPVL
jgi:hypothetical protein